MAIRGDFKEFELNDIFQFIQMGNKDGALYIKGKNGNGVIYFEKGNIKHAETGKYVGTDAINVFLTWDSGTFEFIPEERTDKVTIDLPINSVILEAARQIDEWKKMEDVIPSEEVVVDFEEEPEVTDIELRPLEWKALSIIDGEKTIREIAEELGMKTFDLAKVLYGLVQSGLIKVKKK
ncbi:MAG: DUF4388 domain-containing protein [candidate division WOR-3 bacterium]